MSSCGATEGQLEPVEPRSAATKAQADTVEPRVLDTGRQHGHAADIRGKFGGLFAKNWKIVKGSDRTFLAQAARLEQSIIG